MDHKGACWFKSKPAESSTVAARVYSSAFAHVCHADAAAPPRASLTPSTPTPPRMFVEVCPNLRTAELTLSSSERRAISSPKLLLLSCVHTFVYLMHPPAAAAPPTPSPIRPFPTSHPPLPHFWISKTAAPGAIEKRLPWRKVALSLSLPLCSLWRRCGGQCGEGVKRPILHSLLSSI